MASNELTKVIDGMCNNVKFLDTFEDSKKSKLIQFSVVFCDEYGNVKTSSDVVLEAIGSDSQKELFIEVNGILVKQFTYDAQMSVTTRATTAITTAVLAGGGANKGDRYLFLIDK